MNYNIGNICKYPLIYKSALYYNNIHTYLHVCVEVSSRTKLTGYKCWTVSTLGLKVATSVSWDLIMVQNTHGVAVDNQKL